MLTVVRNKAQRYFIISGLLFLLFALFTVFVSCFDVQSIGPKQSMVGLATINQYMFQLIGVHLTWYHITDWLGVVAILFALMFAVIGLCQLIKRKDIRKVDRHIIVLGLFYALVIAFYIFFELVIVNYRPIILENSLEASYPSSHTMIVTCIMATVGTQLSFIWPDKKKLCFLINTIAALLIAITVIGRLVSGVHWFTDIVGGLLLSASLVCLYYAVIEHIK